VHFLFLTAMMLQTAECRAQVSGLGKVEFPTSAASSQAQDRFLRGVAALPSFWYPVALEEFRPAWRIEPGFAMANMGSVLEIQALEIAVAASAALGNVEEAIATMRRATSLEEAMPVPPGPPPLIKPSHELFGEILLHAGRAEVGARQFAVSLFRHPGRARSLAGAARAERQ
jgi:hypothetical protein